MRARVNRVTWPGDRAFPKPRQINVHRERGRKRRSTTLAAIRIWSGDDVQNSCHSRSRRCLLASMAKQPDRARIGPIPGSAWTTDGRWSGTRCARRRDLPEPKRDRREIPRIHRQPKRLKLVAKIAQPLHAIITSKKPGCARIDSPQPSKVMESEMRDNGQDFRSVQIVTTPSLDTANGVSSCGGRAVI